MNSGTAADIVATDMGTIFVKQPPEIFQYDTDGNLTNDGRWSYAGSQFDFGFQNFPSRKRCCYSPEEKRRNGRISDRAANQINGHDVLFPPTDSEVVKDAVFLPGSNNY